MPSEEPATRERLAWRAVLDNALFAREIVGSLDVETFADDRRGVYAAT